MNNSLLYKLILYKFIDSIGVTESEFIDGIGIRAWASQSQILGTSYSMHFALLEPSFKKNILKILLKIKIENCLGDLELLLNNKQ